MKVFLNLKNEKQIALNRIRNIDYNEKLITFVDNRDNGVPYQIDEVLSFYAREDYKPRLTKDKLVTSDYIIEVSQKVFKDELTDINYRNGKYYCQGRGFEKEPQSKDTMIYNIIEALLEEINSRK